MVAAYIAGMVWGVIMTATFVIVQARKYDISKKVQTPYRWTCPACKEKGGEFKLSSNMADVVLDEATKHERVMHGDP